MRTFWNINSALKTISEWQPNCWIQVTCPTDEDQDYLEDKFNIPDYFLSDISDADERARYEYDDGWMLIILRIPYVKEIRSRTPYTTVPLGIIHKRDVTITVCYYETNMMIDFVSYHQKRGEGFTDYVDMIFRLFLSSAVWYLKRLKQINTLIEKAKHNLDHNVNNESLIALSRLQDSLTYFTTSIRGNETLLAKLKFKLQVDELDADLIEDVNIEMSQARDNKYLLGHSRIDHGHLLKHHQQQYEHRDAYPHICVNSDDVAYPHIVALWYEPHQRYGGLSLGIPRRTRHIRCRIGALVGLATPQTTAIKLVYIGYKRKNITFFAYIQFFLLSLQPIKT